MIPYTIALTLMLSLSAAVPWPTGHVVDGPDTQVIGELQYEYARRSDTLMDIARWQNMGHREIRRANPEVDIWVPGEGTRVLIPSLHVLPAGPRDGIVINRAEKRLYYYFDDPDSGQPRVLTHPIGIGRDGRATPASGQTRVVTKLDRPAWYPTEGVRADYASRGIPLASVIPPGPDNPLGEHVLVLDMPGYLIHGTNRPDGVGMRVSQGCVRLYPEHIKGLVETVPLGTPVHFVDQAIKLGYRDGLLYLEVHAGADGEAPDPGMVMDRIDAWIANHAHSQPIDPERVASAASAADGIPAVITASAR
ncbi:MAG: L,D-transpeptidase family protein [Wenzhouxiangella sp.]